MDVTLPNGVVIRGVPEGTGKHVIAQKAIRNGLATNKDFGYDEALQDEATYLEGIGAGLTNVAKRATNMVLPDSLTPEWASDEAIANQAEIDQGLGTRGQLGKMTGEIVGTLPVGGAGGAVLKGARAARAASSAPTLLTRTMASPATRAVLEGGTIGAVLADPDDRLGGATSGAVLSGALSAVGRGVGAGLRKITPSITKEAEELQNLTHHFIPLSQAARKGITRQVYNALLANIPGVGGKIRGQYKQAVDDFRRFAVENAMPSRSHVVFTGKETAQEVLERLDDFWQGNKAKGIAGAFDEIKDWKQFRIFREHNGLGLNQKMAKELSEHTGLSIPKKGEIVTGEHLLELKTGIGELASKYGSRKASIMRKAKENIDDILEKNLATKNGQGPGDVMLANYREAVEKFPVYQSIRAAAKNLKDVEFSPSRLGGKMRRRAADEMSDAERATLLGTEALEDFPSRQGLFQTAAALGLGGAALKGAELSDNPYVGGALTLGALIGGGRALASPITQKAISGQYNLMSRYADELRKLGYMTRATGVAANE
jgi:hypothetical protein